MNFFRNVYQLTVVGDLAEQWRQEIEIVVQAALQDQTTGPQENRVSGDPPDSPGGTLTDQDLPQIPRGIPMTGYPPPTAPPLDRPIGYDQPEFQASWTETVLDKKLSMIKLADFNGADENWLKWSKRVRSSFGEAGLSALLSSIRVATANPEANERVYWKLEGATANGAAKTTVSKHSKEKSGHHTWQDLLITYEGDGVLAESAEKVRHRLEGLRLDTTTSALEYIAEFQECISMLEDMKEGYTASKTREMFLDHITDSDYHEVTHSLRFHNMPLEDCYKKVRKEQSLLSLKSKNGRNVKREGQKRKEF